MVTVQAQAVKAAGRWAEGLGSDSALKTGRSNRIDRDLGCGVKGDGSCHFLLGRRAPGEEQGLASAVTSSSGSAAKTADMRVSLWAGGQPPVVFARQTAEEPEERTR